MHEILNGDPAQWRMHDAVRLNVSLFVWIIGSGYLLIIVGLVARMLLKSRGIKFNNPTKVGKSYSTWKKPSPNQDDIPRYRL